ncbi:hypothetical protein J437_LFUL002349 [Ladona fulva]|uniref:Uncharacterized protein n=1 Tax=Ladona fulva TaxID=123851 RepID=A0A8K0P3G4_LADFU|nr:hypothetical protein J437_LFUL002349 [Ladona fulva]
MEVETPFEPTLQVVENGVSSSAARAANSPSEDVQMESESLSEVLLQSESWPSSLPSDWVPIIARDSIRQRRQGPQPPFSDVYLAGMPSKRRKVVSNSKHRGSVSQVISDRVRQAVEASGVGTGVSNDGSGAITGPEQLGQAAAGDQALQQAYREHVLVCLRRRIHSDPDFTPERFPNTASYLLK